MPQKPFLRSQEKREVRSQEKREVRSQEKREVRRKKKSGMKLGLCIGFNLYFVSRNYSTCCKVKNIN